MVDLPNFKNFNEDVLVCTNNPPKQVYTYLNLETNKIDTIEFPDYKKCIKQTVQFRVRPNLPMHLHTKLNILTKTGKKIYN